MFAAGLAVSLAPASRAEDQPSAQPAAATASQPAASAQPASDTQARLEELEKQVAALQSEITSLKTDSTPAVKTAAYAMPETAAAPAANLYTPSSAADDAPKISISSLLGGITLSGFGDVYYGYDYNHPNDNQAGLRSFESPTNGFNFNMAELILDKPADAMSAEGRLGYHVSAGYGSAARVINESDSPFGSSSGDNFYLKEAYFDYLAPIGKGLTITVGKFVTPMGAEVIESNANWNYSRGILFDYAIPFFHFGANAKYVINPQWAVTGYLVNGWNNTLIDHDNSFGQSSGLTYGGSIAYTPNMKWSVIENYFAGPVTDAFGSGSKTFNDWKQVSDTVIGYTPNAKWALQVNGDYGFGPKFYTGEFCDESVVVAEGGPIVCTAGPAIKYWGVAGYAKYTLSPKTNFAVRYEYFDDPDGYACVTDCDRGRAQEVTGTYSYNLTSALLVRGEYRYDFASEPIFYTGSRDVKSQNTAYLSFVYSFSSANLK